MGTNYYVGTGWWSRKHLGKSSVGWKFLHRADEDWPRDQARKLWLERAASGTIIDEYNRRIALAELLAFIETKQTGRSHQTVDDEARSALGPEIYDSLKKSDFECDGYDFCDRVFR